MTIAWDPNTETDLAGYVVQYGTASGQYVNSVDVGLQTSWTLPDAVAGQTYYFVVRAYNTAGLRSAPSAEVSTPTTPPPGPGPTFSVDRTRLTFGAIRSNGTITLSTSPQTILLSQQGAGGMAWTATPTSSWIKITAANGSGNGAFTVAIQNVGLPSLGTAEGTIVVTCPGSATPPQTISIRVTVLEGGTTTGPGGVFDTPSDGATNITGSMAVTGWAVDDVEVEKVEIYRDPVNGEPVRANGKVYIGDAVFVAGSRTDIEALFPDVPLAYRAGWGYLMLTYGLPDRGNGTFTLHAYAYDAEGNERYLGSKRITCNNRAATKPFGTIDTPTQGGTASGQYYNFGWVLTPGANSIPIDGSTLQVYVDGTLLGNLKYNNYRQDIALAFPGFANASGAGGVFLIDTTKLTNGVHTIGWLVKDSAGNQDGVGSRFFTVMNTGASDLTAASTTQETAQIAVQSATVATSGAQAGAAIGQSSEQLADVPPANGAVEVTRAFESETPRVVVPDWMGDVHVETSEMSPVEVRLGDQFSGWAGDATFEGYLVVGGELRPLPIGSSLDTTEGVFRWQPGLGFVGSYEFVFVRNGVDGWKTKVPVKVEIRGKAGEGQDPRGTSRTLRSPHIR